MVKCKGCKNTLKDDEWFEILNVRGICSHCYHEYWQGKDKTPPELKIKFNTGQYTLDRYLPKKEGCEQ